MIVGDYSASGWQVSKVQRDGWQVVGYGRAVGPPVQFVSLNELTVQTEADGVASFGRWDFAAGKFTQLPKSASNISFVSADAKTLLVSTPKAFAEIRYEGNTVTDLNPQVKNCGAADRQARHLESARWQDRRRRAGVASGL